jgi:hypothetical protein
MKKKGLIVILIALALLAVGFAIIHRQAIAPSPIPPQGGATATETTAAEPKLSWRFETEESGDGLPPKTQVALFADGNAYDAGTYAGSCAEIASENLLPGEVSGVLCWYAGGGDEIGVFRDEDLNYTLLHGTQEEGTAESDGVRGDFKEIAVIR